MHALKLDALGLHDDRLRGGVQRADRHALVRRVRAQDRVRIVVVAGDEAIELFGGHGGSGHVGTSSCSSRAIPATGIGTHSGRLLSS